VAIIPDVCMSASVLSGCQLFGYACCISIFVSILCLYFIAIDHDFCLRGHCSDIKLL
jgi:hypothetical protein